ncbi:HipA domain-containing protein [Kineosporia mesophila]|uniref:HipA domain-containing protein n=1 Tax=Kineosporia mesophila TaxID=566012 RepID=A0ABP7ADI1_9ACTN
MWLPGATEPVVAGSVNRSGATFQGQEVLLFTYARSYRERERAISLFGSELPIGTGTFDPTGSGWPPADALGRRRSPLPMHSCLRDAAPDAWGRRVINLRLAGNPEAELSELTYLAGSGSDRIGALDFQDSPTRYEHRGEGATLDQLIEAAELIEAGQSLPEGLLAAAGHGTSIGGARPKALLSDGDRHLIAKFSSTTDTRPVVKAEAASMLMAARVGVDVAPVALRTVNGKDVLLVERFDRPGNGTRRLVLSALTVLGLSEMESRHSSYAEIARVVRAGAWTAPDDTLQELYLRLVFNVCVGNTDDHLRNHAVFWDGANATLTPAYDLAPQPRSTQVATHAIGITSNGERASQLRLCRQVAPEFHLSSSDADDIIDHTVSTIEKTWDEVSDEALLTGAERASLWGREFLNPYIFYDNA